MEGLTFIVQLTTQLMKKITLYKDMSDARCNVFTRITGSTLHNFPPSSHTNISFLSEERNCFKTLPSSHQNADTESSRGCINIVRFILGKQMYIQKEDRKFTRITNK